MEESTIIDNPAPSPESQGGAGHRMRIIERFISSGISALHPHEVIEILLTFAIPRKDTKKPAKELLGRFRTIGGLINAPLEEIEKVEGITRRAASLFPLIKEIMGLCLREKFEKQEMISHRRDVEEYLRFYFGQRRDEYVAALFLDNANHVLKTDIISEGTVNQCAVYPRTIVERALGCKAASILIAHNHPGGSLNPSEADWLLTERIFQIGKLLELPLLDHIIISSNKVVSLRDLSRWPH